MRGGGAQAARMGASPSLPTPAATSAATTGGSGTASEQEGASAGCYGWMGHARSGFDLSTG